MLVQKHALATRMGTVGQIVLNLTQQFENLVYSTIQNRFKKCSKIYIYIRTKSLSWYKSRGVCTCYILLTLHNRIDLYFGRVWQNWSEACNSLLGDIGEYSFIHVATSSLAGPARKHKVHSLINIATRLCKSIIRPHSHRETNYKTYLENMFRVKDTHKTNPTKEQRKTEL